MRDEVFSAGDFQKGSFRFNNAVASVFDDMANRSIPFYREVIQLTGKIAQSFVPDNGRIYDLGCSTGNTLMFLAQSLQNKKVKLIGCDPAEAMLKKAAEKAEAFTYSHDIEFIQNTCENIELANADMIIMNYTLQFIDKAERPVLLKKIYDALKPGGTFIISEKLKQKSEIVENFNTKTYENFKAGNGYSELEIANKRQALENILVPGSLDENIEQLQKAGFEETEVIFKWLNFATFAGFKKA